MSASRLVIDGRTVQALKDGSGFEIRLIEGSTFVTPKLLLTLDLLRKMEREPITLRPLILQAKHPNVTIYKDGMLWAEFDHSLWGLLLGSQVAGEPRTITKDDGPPA